MPSKAVEFQDEALLDYRASMKWYLERSFTAASKFADEVELAIAAIAENPQRWPVNLDGTRKFLLPNFPFAVIYREFTSSVQVVAIAHGKRRPDYWKKRG
jgi:plasmid stabilization system protein ParE